MSLRDNSLFPLRASKNLILSLPVFTLVCALVATPSSDTSGFALLGLWILSGLIRLVVLHFPPPPVIGLDLCQRSHDSAHYDTDAGSVFLIVFGEKVGGERPSSVAVPRRVDQFAAARWPGGQPLIWASYWAGDKSASSSAGLASLSRKSQPSAWGAVLTRAGLSAKAVLTAVISPVTGE